MTPEQMRRYRLITIVWCGAAVIAANILFHWLATEICELPVGSSISDSGGSYIVEGKWK